MDKICHIPYYQLKELIRKSVIYDFYVEAYDKEPYVPRDNRWLETYSTKIADSYLPR